MSNSLEKAVLHVNGNSGMSKNLTVDTHIQGGGEGRQCSMAVWSMLVASSGRALDEPWASPENILEGPGHEQKHFLCVNIERTF